MTEDDVEIEELRLAKNLITHRGIAALGGALAANRLKIVDLENKHSSLDHCVAFQSCCLTVRTHEHGILKLLN